MTKDGVEGVVWQLWDVCVVAIAEGKLNLASVDCPLAREIMIEDVKHYKATGELLPI